MPSPFLQTIIIIFTGVSCAIIFVYLIRLARRLLHPILFYWQMLNNKKNNPWPTLSETKLSPIDLLLQWSGYSHRAGLFKVVVSVSAAVVVISIIIQNISGVFIGIVIISFISLLIISRSAQNKRKCVRSLPDALSALTDTLRAGFSLPQAIAFLAEELDAPVKNIFSTLQRSYVYQVHFSKALQVITEQIALTEWVIVAEALAVVGENGGNSIPLLEETARALRDRLNSEQEVKTLTASGRLSGMLVAGLVPVVLVFFWFVSPAYISILFTSATGRILLVVACALEIAGFIWIRQVVSVEY